MCDGGLRRLGAALGGRGRGFEAGHQLQQRLCLARPRLRELVGSGTTPRLEFSALNFLAVKDRRFASKRPNFDADSSKRIVVF